MLIQNSFAFSDSVLVYLVGRFDQLNYGWFGAWLRTVSAAILRLHKVKELWLPSRLRVGHDGWARLANIFYTIEEVLILYRIWNLDLHGLGIACTLSRVLITLNPFAECSVMIIFSFGSVAGRQLHHLVLTVINQILLLVRECALVNASDEKRAILLLLGVDQFRDLVDGLLLIDLNVLPFNWFGCLGIVCTILSYRLLLLERPCHHAASRALRKCVLHHLRGDVGRPIACFLFVFILLRLVVGRSVLGGFEVGASVVAIRQRGAHLARGLLLGVRDYHGILRLVFANLVRHFVVQTVVLAFESIWGPQISAIDFRLVLLIIGWIFAQFRSYRWLVLDFAARVDWVAGQSVLPLGRVVIAAALERCNPAVLLMRSRYLGRYENRERRFGQIRRSCWAVALWRLRVDSCTLMGSLWLSRLLRETIYSFGCDHASLF